MYSCPLHNWISYESPCPSCARTITTSGDVPIQIDTQPSSGANVLVEAIYKIQKELNKRSGLTVHPQVNNWVNDVIDEAIAKYNEVEPEKDDFTKKHMEKIWQKLKDSNIHLHIEKLWGGLDMASVQHFVETGKINGGFMIALNKLMDSVRGWHHSSQSGDRPIPIEPDDDWREIIKVVEDCQFISTKYVEVIETLKNKYHITRK